MSKPTTPCVLWPGAKSLGYGKHHTTLAHRKVWEQAHGPLPDGWVVHHRCYVKTCVALDHLQAMPRGDHIKLHLKDAGRKNANEAKTHCPQGHAYADNTYLYRNMRMCKACRLEAQRRFTRKKQLER